MAKKAEDRRAQRTRALLHHALIALVLKKGYDAVTIQDIVDEANVGRSTFYAHYTGKEQLFRSGFEMLRTLLVEQQGSALATGGDLKERSLGFSRAMFEHAAGHKDIYRALTGGRGGTVALDQIRRLLSELVRNDLAATLDDQAAKTGERELLVQYVVGAFMAVLTWWLDGRVKLPPEQVDAIFRRLTLQGIMSARSA